jgi:cell division protein FtsW (lipid II flippase)
MRGDRMAPCVRKRLLLFINPVGAQQAQGSLPSTSSGEHLMAQASGQVCGRGTLLGVGQIAATGILPSAETVATADTNR